VKKVISIVALIVLALAIGIPTGNARTHADQDLVGTAVAAGKFTTLAKLLTRAGLVGALQKPGPYTVFAPTDAAFAKVPRTTLNALLHNRAKLRSVLLYHVVPGKVTAADVIKLSSAKTVNGKPVRIRVAGSQVFVNTAKVTTPDVMATNGVIHVVNRVLIPPTG
jgi:uncharacterized surface protein with fasciclin (FAS1) repeats